MHHARIIAHQQIATAQGQPPFSQMEAKNGCVNRKSVEPLDERQLASGVSDEVPGTDDHEDPEPPRKGGPPKRRRRSNGHRLNVCPRPDPTCSATRRDLGERATPYDQARPKHLLPGSSARAKRAASGNSASITRTARMNEAHIKSPSRKLSGFERNAAFVVSCSGRNPTRIGMPTARRKAVPASEPCSKFSTASYGQRRSSIALRRIAPAPRAPLTVTYAIRKRAPAPRSSTVGGARQNPDLHFRMAPGQGTQATAKIITLSPTPCTLTARTRRGTRRRGTGSRSGCAPPVTRRRLAQRPLLATSAAPDPRPTGQSAR